MSAQVHPTSDLLPLPVEPADRPRTTQSAIAHIASPRAMDLGLAIRVQTPAVGPQPSFPPPQQGEVLSYRVEPTGAIG